MTVDHTHVLADILNAELVAVTIPDRGSPEAIPVLQPTALNSEAIVDIKEAGIAPNLLQFCLLESILHYHTDQGVHYAIVSQHQGVNAGLSLSGGPDDQLEVLPRNLYVLN